MSAPVQHPLTIPALTAAAAEHFGDHPAVVDGDTTLTYVELVEAARTFAAALVASGVEAGDRVALWSFNSVEWIVAVLGVFEAGAVLVPVNTRFKAAEAADILRRSGARVLVTTTDFLGVDYVALLEGIRGELPVLETVVALRGPATGGSVAWADFLARATDDGPGRGRPPRRRPRPRRPLRHHVHLGHHRRSEGRRADPRPHPA